MNPVREDPNRASVRRNPTCSFSGADDGIRTRDPHLGNRMAIGSCVSSRLSSAPEPHVLGAPVSSVSPNSWRRLHFVGDFVGADAPTDERVKGRSSSPADSRARLGSVLIRPELEFVAGKRAGLGGELLLQDSAPVSCLTLILWPVHHHQVRLKDENAPMPRTLERRWISLNRPTGSAASSPTRSSGVGEIMAHVVTDFFEDLRSRPEPAGRPRGDPLRRCSARHASSPGGQTNSPTVRSDERRRTREVGTGAS